MLIDLLIYYLKSKQEIIYLFYIGWCVIIFFYNYFFILKNYINFFICLDNKIKNFYFFFDIFLEDIIV